MKNEMKMDYFFDKHKLDKEYMEDFKKICPYIDEEHLPIHGNKLFFKMDNINSDKKIELIELFLDSYFNTPQDKSVFSSEYVTVTSFIVKGLIPLKLEFLIVEEIYDEIYKILSC